MKKVRKLLSIILCISMIICSTLPNFANENDLAETTSESKIVEQLKIDLGEEKAEEIIGSSVDESEVDDSDSETVGESYESTDDGIENTIENEESISVDDIESSTESMQETSVDYESTTMNSNEFIEEPESEGETTVISFDETISGDDISDNIGTIYEEVIATGSDVESDVSNDEELGNITIEFDVEKYIDEDIATKSELIGDKLLGTNQIWCYWYIDETDPDNITIHYSNTEPANFSEYADDKKGSEDYTNTPRPEEDVAETVKTAVFDNVITARNCSGWFSGFTALTSITNLTYLKVDGIMFLDSIFFDCHSLTSVDLSGFNTSNAYSMSEMFYRCSSLTNLDLSNFNTENVWYMDQMFYGCSNLETLNISSFNTSNVEADELFYNCSSLHTIYAIKSINARLAHDVDMFLGCTSLVGGNETTYNLQHIDGEYARVDAINAPGYFTLYGGEETPTLQSVEIVASPKLQYVVGQVFDPENLRIKYTYDNAAISGFVDYTNDTSSSFTFDPPLSNAYNTEGSYTITIIYGGISCSLEIEVSDYWCYWYIDESDSDNVTIHYSSTEPADYSSYASGKKGRVYTSNQIPGPNSSSVKNLIKTAVFDNVIGAKNCASWFYGYKNMTQIINLSENLNTSNVTSMKQMFRDCYALTSIDSSSFNTTNVTDMSYMFSECRALPSVDLSSFNTVNVTNMSYMFSKCGVLTNLDLSTFNTISVTNMSYMFQNCTQLARIEVTNTFVTIGLTGGAYSSYYMFMGCTSLVGGNGTSYNSSIVNANYACIDREGRAGYFTLKDGADGSFTHIFPNNWYNEILTGVSKSAVTKIKFQEGGEITDYDRTWNIDNYSLKGYIVNDTEVIVHMLEGDKIKTSQNCVMMFSFDKNYESSLKIIENIGMLDTSDSLDMSLMFYGDRELINLDLSSFNTANVASMQNMFRDCNRLTSITGLSEFNTSGVFDMNGMFNGCSRLQNIDFTNFNTSNVTDMSYMFCNCSRLESIDLSKFNTSNVLNMDGMFSFCTSLTTIYSDTTFVIDNVSSSENMFLNCFDLIGGNGTTYDEDKVDKEYACIDVEGRPGYFSDTDTPVDPDIHNLDSITIITAPTKISYQVGEKFNPAGLKIMRHYVGGNNMVLTYNDSTKNKFSFNPSLTTALTEAATQVTITYGGKSCTQSITVTSQREIASISIIRRPTKVNYTVGNYLRPAGLKIRVHYEDNTTEDITYSSSNASLFTFNPTLRTRLAVIDNQVTVTYKGKTATFNITVTRNGGGDVPGGGGESNRPSGGGGGGNSGSGPIPAANMQNLTPATTHLQVLKHIVGTVDSSLSSWSADPNTGKFRLNIVDATGQIVNATNGFYQINQNTTQNVNGIDVQVPVNNTYYFDAGGYMVTGWIQTADSKWYFFENAKTNDEGKMQIGWKQIQGVWYFFGTDGTMYQNRVTPDGFTVDANGALVQA